MTARRSRLLLVVLTLGSMGANHKSENFSVTAPSEAVARQVALAAEDHRRQLAEDWFGDELPRWSERCAISVRPGTKGPNGFTTFLFTGHDVVDWKMTVEGSLDEILDSVLPHEISHTVFATHFNRPVPRWADEGASLLAECETERLRQRQFAGQLLRSGRSIPLRKLMTMKQYPQDRQQVLAVYAQGHSVAEFLVNSAGRREYIEFLGSAERLGWDKAIKRHYGFRDIEALETRFQGWLTADRPAVRIPDGMLLANGRFEGAVPEQVAVATDAPAEAATGE